MCLSELLKLQVYAERPAIPRPDYDFGDMVAYAKFCHTVLSPARQPLAVIRDMWYLTPCPVKDLSPREIKGHFDTPVEHVHLDPRPVGHCVHTNTSRVWWCVL